MTRPTDGRVREVPERSVTKLLGKGWEYVDGPTPAPEELDPAPGPQVPDGPVAEVMEWVDGQPALAKQALEAEQAREDGPRKSLVAQLEKLVDES